MYVYIMCAHTEVLVFARVDVCVWCGGWHNLVPRSNNYLITDKIATSYFCPVASIIIFVQKRCNREHPMYGLNMVEIFTISAHMTCDKHVFILGVSTNATCWIDVVIWLLRYLQWRSSYWPPRSVLCYLMLQWFVLFIVVKPPACVLTTHHHQ